MWSKRNKPKQNNYASKSRSKRPEHYLEKRRINQNRRRVRKVGNGGIHSIQEWNNLINFYGKICLSCGSKPKRLEIDHVVPLALGGSDFISNIQPLCKRCNSKKQTTVIDFRLTLMEDVIPENLNILKYIKDT
jgi:5-methylcytosine-specific restriction endonuclease McrA